MHASIPFSTMFGGMVLATCNTSLGACHEQPNPPNLEYLFTVQATQSPLAPPGTVIVSSFQLPEGPFRVPNYKVSVLISSTTIHSTVTVWSINLLIPGVVGNVPGIGGDWGSYDTANTVFSPDAQIVLETNDGTNILMSGHGRSPYFAVEFETGNENYSWMNAIQTLGTIEVGETVLQPRFSNTYDIPSLSAKMLYLLYKPTTYAVLRVVFLAVYTVYRAALPRPIAGITYHKDSATRILGDAPAMIKHKQQYETVFDWMTQHAVELNSPISQLFLEPFSQPVVVITDPREAQDILLRRAKDFDRSQFFEDVFGGTVPYNHVIQPTNDKFRQGRRLLADTMAASFLNRVAAPLLRRHSIDLIELWRVKIDAAAGHAFWAADDLNNFALDSIWDVAFGNQLNSLPEETAFSKPSPNDPINLPKPQLNAAVNSMKILTHGLDVAMLRMTLSYRRARIYKERLVQERLDDAKVRLLDRTHETTDDLKGITCATDHLLRREAQAASKENRAPNYESKEAKDELFGFMVDGFDTTATTLMWSTKLMADSPRVQSKLRQALLDAFGETNGARTAELLITTRIPYLDAVVEEIVRCAQTSSSAARRAVRDTQLLGHHIPKGVDVYMMANGPGYIVSNDLNEKIPENMRTTSSQENKHRIPSWESSDIGVFRPERWIKIDERGKETFDVHAGPSMRFGAGLRGCFGKKLAYLEFRILLTVLMWTYELQLLPEKLRGYEAFDSLTHKPKKCYLY
ncbi:hypothetical protein MMC13_000926 [Lambiella insularis]|nr:hypothetical protein [Lambiella insularis]